MDSNYDVVGLFLDLWGLESTQERLIVMLLDGQHRLLGSYLHDFGVGVMRRVKADQIVRSCGAVQASYVVVFHSLPTDQPTATSSHHRFAHQLMSVCEGVEIELLEIIVIGADRSYVSLGNRQALAG